MGNQAIAFATGFKDSNSDGRRRRPWWLFTRHFSRQSICSLH